MSFSYLRGKTIQIIFSHIIVNQIKSKQNNKPQGLLAHRQHCHLRPLAGDSQFWYLLNATVFPIVYATFFWIQINATDAFHFRLHILDLPISR